MQVDFSSILEKRRAKVSSRAIVSLCSKVSLRIKTLIYAKVK